MQEHISIGTSTEKKKEEEEKDAIFTFFQM